MDIINKTQKPLSVPLPGGKKLFLGPNKTGQVNSKALEHPPLVKLLEAGDIEKIEGGVNRKTASGANKWAPTGSRHDGTGTIHHGGDR